MALEDIGEGNNTALLCMTRFNACCNASHTKRGIWLFPNGTEVNSTDVHQDFYRTRGQMVVRMHRRKGGEEGIYHCKIPDSLNVTQNIYIGVYSVGE